MFKSKKINSGLSIGQRLKKARLRKKYTLEHVEKKTKIRNKYLVAIENDSFSRLPNQVYAKGFIKTYAKFLDLNADDIVEQYKMENALNIEEDFKSLPKSRISFPKIVISSKTLIISSIIIGVLGFATFLFFQVQGFLSAPELVIYQPEKDGQTNSDQIAFVGKTDSGSEIYINDQQVAIDSQGNFKEEVFLKNGNNLIEIKAKNKAGKETKKVFNFVANIVSSAKDTSSEPKIIQQLNMKLVIGPKSSWVKVVADGVIAYQGVMLANTQQEFIGKKEILLSTSNAGSTRVIINEKDNGLLGQNGEAKKDIKYSN